ncbi:PrgI family protein [Candidatus Daviesbacteria bacterium]|nr:PrgI family protein [Candidatus Daviesbacteria bacterium]
MESHPIPQNVTTFQFHLVGDMTLKQFIYLATGSGLAYFVFIFFVADYPYFAWPLILTAAGLGTAFAFLPINSRPLDYWTAAFLKAIYSPTKRVWKKNNKSYQEDPTFNSRLFTYLAGLQPIQQQPVPPVYNPPHVAKSVTAEAPPLPTPEQLGKTVDLARQAQNLQMKIIQTERTLNQIKTAAQSPTQIPVDYTQQVNTVLSDLQNLVTQASQIKQQIEFVHQPEPTNTLPLPIAPRPKVTVIVPTKAKVTQVALTTFPNVINGIVKDANANYLEGVVVVIYDKEGLPVRALKTNKLGQFTGSTPLPNSIYTVELEKDGFAFDVLQVELTGTTLPPLTITAKGPGVS